MRPTVVALSLACLLIAVVSCSSDAGSPGIATSDAAEGEVVVIESTATECQDGDDNDEDGDTDCADADCAGYTFCAGPSETTAAACSDGADNDGDSKADCADSDCTGYMFCEAALENSPAACQDGVDNDGDEAVDCGDTECSGFLFCGAPTETTAGFCQDTVDNDEDGDTDCADADCGVFAFCAGAQESTAATCKDGADNDADSAIDCEDDDCQVFIFCAQPVETTAGLCSDGEDNDGDELIDCEDPDCGGFLDCAPVTEQTATQCTDQVDNDLDELVDCDDEDCQGYVFCAAAVEDSPAECVDTVDNDGDDLVDCADPDCAALVSCALPTELSAADCQDGEDNDGDELVDCSDHDCQGYVFCVAVPEDSFVTCQDGIDNDGDGAIDCQDVGCFAIYICGVYNGFPLVDSWGSVWDGMDRPKATLDAARNKCLSLGGRLPTASELVRNNLTTGAADIGGAPGSDYLWTLIPTVTAGQFVGVRLVDGGRQSSVATTPYSYRCIWPGDEGTGFDDGRCYGPPDASCIPQEHGMLNIDANDRPAMDWVSATTECTILGAGLPTFGEYADMIHAGLPNGTDAWLWVANSAYWYSGGNGSYVVRFKGTGTSDWWPNYPNTQALSWHYSAQSFRCIGLAERAPYKIKEMPPCTGQCFDVGKNRRAPLLADGTDRAVTSFNLAFEACRNLGGFLPMGSEFGDLVHMGWTTPTDQWLWTADLISWYYLGFGLGISKWNAAQTTSWNYQWGQTFNVATGNASWGYRCVWLPTWSPAPDCQTGETVKWDGDAYSCSEATGGTSDGHAYNGEEVVDPWGDAWDHLERPAATWKEAADDCKAVGGRLPLPAEVYRSNAVAPLAVFTLGKDIDANWLWTSVGPGAPGTHVQTRVSDGTTGVAADTAKAAYRCVWPLGEADALWGRNCLGTPDAGCFIASGGMRIDAFDRPAADFAAAVNECLAAGGHMADGRQMATAIFSGAQNGSDAWLWIADPDYWHAGAYGVDLVRWKGEGTAAWQADGTVHNEDYANTKHGFRCVFDPVLR